MIPGTGFYGQLCETPSAELVVTESDEVTLTALVCCNRKCGIVVVVSQSEKPPKK